ncbi:MAG: Lrp/AsnC family transcriptional regulator [Nanoarchaeota archaeon]
MDKKDQKILAELVLNSRIPFNQLAKKVGVSKEVVAYRIKRLVENKIIDRFNAIVNIEKLGFNRNGCWIQFKGVDSTQERKLFNYLKNHKFITYAGIVVGKWNVALDIISKDKYHLKKIIEEIISEIGPNLGDYGITNNTTESEIFPTKVLGFSSEFKSIESKEKAKIDNKDKFILKKLVENSKIEYVELASILNLSANAVKYRIKRLENIGVISSYTISINFDKLGLELYAIQIKLNSVLNEQKLKNFLRNHPKISFFYKYLGHQNWDIDIGVYAKNSSDLRNVILDIRNELGTMIKIEDIFSNVEILKPDVAPEGVFT